MALKEEFLIAVEAWQQAIVAAAERSYFNREHEAKKLQEAVNPQNPLSVTYVPQKSCASPQHPPKNSTNWGPSVRTPAPMRCNDTPETSA